MHLKLLRAAARAAVCGGIVALGLGSTLAAPAVAQAQAVVFVPCSTAKLVLDMTSPLNNTTLMLAPNCTYTLTAQLPTVMKTMRIVGYPSTWIKRSTMADPFSVFVVGCMNGNLTLSNVNVRNGGGSTDEAGGAVDITNGSATIDGGTFADNTVDSAAGDGGAIANHGNLTVNAATFTDNSADFGGAIYSENTDPTVRGGTFRGNYASTDGGAIYNDSGTLAVIGGTYTDNSSGSDGGAVYNAATMTLTGTSFSQNDSTDGGALYNGDIMTLTSNLISRNIATDGGGIYNDTENTLTINNSVITYNTSTDTTAGGGIDNDLGTVTITAGLISQNQSFNCSPLNSITGCVD